MSADEAGVGHNSDVQRIAADQLRSFVERVERLEEEKKTIADDIKDVKMEAKSAGYDMKVFAEMLRLRKMEKDALLEFEAIRDTYGQALGVFG